MTGTVPAPPPGWCAVVRFPVAPVVLDLSSAWAGAGPPWSVGRYDEVRGVYTQPLFGGRRTLHVGVDLGAPVGTPVHAPGPGWVRYAAVNGAAGDYGPTLVLEHTLDDRPLFVLLGHLSVASLAASPPGRRVAAGEVVGWVGAPEENGGWPPHVHVQLSRDDPGRADMPGVVEPAERHTALARHPDPRRILGPLW